MYIYVYHAPMYREWYAAYNIPGTRYVPGMIPVSGNCLLLRGMDASMRAH